jgi:flagellar hook-basal body complex protein FliE
MRRRRSFLLSVALASVAALTSVACADPPDKEIQQAQGAIDTARAAGADQYAHDEFAAAEDALKRAHEAVAQRDYRLALNNALDARERAQSAAKEAADRKTTARVDAERELLDAMTALNDANTRLRAAEAARPPAKTLAAPKRVIVDSEAALQKARAMFDRGDYLAVIDVAKATTARLRGSAHDLDAAAAAPVRRRR